MEDGSWRDWAGLPSELIHLISKKLHDLPDFLQLRAVCKEWCSALPLTDPPPQLPWVLEYCTPKKGYLRFYSLATGKIYKIQVQEAGGKRFLGPGHRYLLEILGYRSSFYSKVNPITQSTVPFASPPIPGLESFGQNLIQSWNRVMLLEGGDHNWICVKNMSFSPAYYYSGKLFVQKGCGPTNVLDATTGNLLYSMISPIGRWAPPMYREEYLVESAGELLRVHRLDTPSFGTSHFIIFRLQFGSAAGNTNARWVEISTINDQMLFLSDRRGLSLSANNFSGFKGNSIYYFSRGPIFELCRYDIETCAKEVLPCSLKKGCTWLVPCLDTANASLPD